MLGFRPYITSPYVVCVRARVLVLFARVLYPSLCTVSGCGTICFCTHIHITLLPVQQCSIAEMVQALPRVPGQVWLAIPLYFNLISKGVLVPNLCFMELAPEISNFDRSIWKSMYTPPFIKNKILIIHWPTVRYTNTQ